MAGKKNGRGVLVSLRGLASIYIGDRDVSQSNNYALPLPTDGLYQVVAFTTPKGEHFARAITAAERARLDKLLAKGSSPFDAYAAVCSGELPVPKRRTKRN